MRLPKAVTRRSPAIGTFSALVLAALGSADGLTAQDFSGTGLPLEGARALDLRTSQGSWISLDVSPDGRTIVFDLLGDLYLLPIDGGKARSLTSGMAYDAQPRFSPDGRRVLFVSDASGGENLWTISIDGRDTTRITTGDQDLYVSPEWTPDGKYVVASKSEVQYTPPKPWLFHAEGGSGMKLVKEPAGSRSVWTQLKLIGAAFGPDPRYIWFARRQGDWQYYAILPQYQLAVYDRLTGELTDMSARHGSAFRPALSPDGKWLTYGSRHDEHTGLVLRDLRTGDERWLAYPIQRDEQESRATLDVIPGYGFTPDSRAVVLSYGGEIWRVPVDGSAPIKIPFTVETRLALGPEVDFQYRIDDAPELTVRQIRDAVPSPDGRWLAFTALNQLYLLGRPAGAPRRIAARVADGIFHPSWSPDGRTLAFVTWDDRRGGHLWRTSADGSGESRRLTDLPGFYQHPAWSPAGDRLVVLRTPARTIQEGVSSGGLSFAPGQGAEFVWFPASGGAATPIAPASGRHHPHFAGQSERIYAYSSERGLVSFRWDGTDVREHLKVLGPEVADATHAPAAELVVMGPDREHALAQVGSAIYVVAVPEAGGETPSVRVGQPSTATFPVQRLTTTGGQFPSWSADGRKAHWTLGNAHFAFELDRLRLLWDSAAGGPHRAVEQRITVRAKRDLPEGVAVLRGARAITMRGKEIITDADIVIRNHRIAAVGPRGEVDVPAGAKVIDLRGKTVLPGFVDTHYHSQSLLSGVHTSGVWQYATNLAYGVTTTRDPQTFTTDVLTYQDRVETGELMGPRVYATGPGVLMAERVRSLEHASEILRKYSDYWDTKTFKMYLAGNRRQRQWLVMAARDLRLTPTVEAGIDFKLNMTHAIDGYAGLEHTVPVVPLYRDVVALFETSGITYSPTLLVSFNGPKAELWFFTTENVHGDSKLRRFTPHGDIDRKARRRGVGPPSDLTGTLGWAMREEYVFDEQARFARDLIEAGGNVGVGAHGQLHGLGYHWELWALQSGGMAPHDALRAATILGAEAIGFDQDIGTLEPGKLADLVVLDRDPLADVRNTNTVRYVMKNGRLYEGDTLDEIYPRARPFERRYYWEGEPEPAAGIRP